MSVANRKKEREREERNKENRQGVDKLIVDNGYKKRINEYGVTQYRKKEGINNFEKRKLLLDGLIKEDAKRIIKILKTGQVLK